ncbi:MAG: hypothetical protein ABEK59_07140 [Halobacteria archaeon]
MSGYTRLVPDERLKYLRERLHQVVHAKGKDQCWEYRLSKPKIPLFKRSKLKLPREVSLKTLSYWAYTDKRIKAKKLYRSCFNKNCGNPFHIEIRKNESEEPPLPKKRAGRPPKLSAEEFDPQKVNAQLNKIRTVRSKQECWEVDIRKPYVYGRSMGRNGVKIALFKKDGELAITDLKVATYQAHHGLRLAANQLERTCGNIKCANPYHLTFP